MQAISAHALIMDNFDGAVILQKIERCGRVCYKSEDKITEGSAEKFVKGIISRGHESVLEHFSFTVLFVVDRGVSHEIVRHRLASYSQESTRYCNYGNAKECTFIVPCFLKYKSPAWDIWCNQMKSAEKAYLDMLDSGSTPQEARSVLPNSLKTEVMMTANLREWRHFLKMRCSKAAHPQIREVAVPLLHLLQETIPVVFDDIQGE